MDLRENKALTDEIFSTVEEVGLYRRLLIEYTVSHERLLESLLRVFAILSRLRRHVSLQLLERTRVFFTDNLKFYLDQPEAMAEMMAWAWLSGDGDEADLETQERMYRDMTEEDVLDAAQAIFRSGNLCCHILKNPAKIQTAALKETLKQCRKLLE